MRLFRSRFLLLIVGTMIPPPVIAQDTSGLRVGQVIGNELGQVINGWKQQGGELVQTRVTENYITREIDECCVTIFTKGNVYQFAITEPIARTRRGGVEAERITILWNFTPAAGEEPVDCNLMWIRPVASFSTGPGKVIRSVIYNGEEFTVIRWFDPGMYCSRAD